jgi:hypothetical protein
VVILDIGIGFERWKRVATTRTEGSKGVVVSKSEEWKFV